MLFLSGKAAIIKHICVINPINVIFRCIKNKNWKNKTINVILQNIKTITVILWNIKTINEILCSIKTINVILGRIKI